MELIWIIFIILYMVWRAYSEAQKKQAASQRRQAEIEAANRRRRGEVTQADMEPVQEVPWDFDPDEYKRRTSSQRVEVREARQVLQAEESIYQKKLKEIGDKKRDKPKNVAEPVVVSEITEPASAGFSFQLDNKSLINAVIMSEVLQAPRSKRPIRAH